MEGVGKAAGRRFPGKFEEDQCKDGQGLK